MASIDVDTAALHAAAGSIGGIADTLTAAPSPAVAVSSAQATGAAVNAVHAAATAMSAGAASFAATERASTEAITAIAPGEQ